MIVEQGFAVLRSRSDEAPDLFQGESRILCASHRCGAAEVLGTIPTVPKGVSHGFQNPLILPVPQNVCCDSGLTGRITDPFALRST